MSLRALLWAIHDAPVNNHGELAVLNALADRASDDGTAAYPSQKWVAYRARCSDRAVRNHLKALEERGLIRRGDQRLVGHFEEGKRPVVWDLDMTMKREHTYEEWRDEERKQRAEKSSGHDTPRKQPSVGPGSSVPANPGKSVQGPRKQGSDKPSLKPSIQPSVNQSSSVDEPESDDFKEFWHYYPRKVGKGKAEDYYREQLSHTTPDVLLDAVKNFATECSIQQTEKRYIPYPSTWLNQGRWKDYNVAPPKNKAQAAPEDFDLDQILSLMQGGQR